MTRQTISNDINRINAQNTFEELFRMGVIPIVNENDTDRNARNRDWR